MRTLLHPRRRLSWRLIRGTTWSLIRPGFASWTTLAALTGVCSERATPNGSPRGSEDREGASDSVPVPKGSWGVFGRISFYVLLAALFAHGNLDIAFTLVSFSLRCLGVALSTLDSGRVLGSTVDTCFTSGFGEFHIFSTCGELRSEAFTLHSAEWRSVHS